jgi:CheY-like chemotaxis protein
MHGEMGLRMLKERSFDIVCLDFLMPVMDGVTCMKYYDAWRREMGYDSETIQSRNNQLIIGMSATAVSLDQEAAFGYGMHLFCSKPVDMVALSIIITAKKSGLSFSQICELNVNLPATKSPTETEEKVSVHFQVENDETNSKHGLRRKFSDMLPPSILKSNASSVLGSFMFNYGIK